MKAKFEIEGIELLEELWATKVFRCYSPQCKHNMINSVYKEKKSYTCGLKIITIENGRCEQFQQGEENE